MYSYPLCSGEWASWCFTVVEVGQQRGAHEGALDSKIQVLVNKMKVLNGMNNMLSMFLQHLENAKIDLPLDMELVLENLGT